MNADTIFVISECENFEFYRTIPLREQWVECHNFDGSTDCIFQRSPCLLLIDCGFNESKGLRLLSEIKAIRPDIMVFFITGSGSEETAVMAFRLGARNYFKKPIDLYELKRAIDKMLIIGGRSAESRIRFESAGLDGIHKCNFREVSDIPANLLRVITYVEKHHSEPITIDQLADVAGISRFHFCRVFKKTMGMRPISYLTLVRLERAKTLLRKNISVTSVALKAGFNDLSNFNRQFKKITGKTPSFYKKSFTII